MSITHFISKVTGYKCNEVDIELFLGIVFATVYAETFSLFYKVAGVAEVGITILCILLAITQRAMIFDFIKKVNSKINKNTYIQSVPIFFLFMVFVIIACQRAYNVDTDLYHAQSIRWIEEYGIVKGLANLHHRFAFNSAFFCLQALFSWKFLIDQSMHVMNTYLCMLIIMYALFTLSLFKRTSVSGGSDAFKLVILFYGAYNVQSMPECLHPIQIIFPFF